MKIYDIINSNFVLAGYTDSQEYHAQYGTTSVDRMGFYSGVFLFAYGGLSISTGQDITLTFDISDSNDDSVYSTPVEFEEIVFDDASNAEGIIELPIDLNSYKRYVLLTVTAVSSNGSDTINFTTTLILGDSDSLPK
jgi:hypothetical protein